MAHEAVNRGVSIVFDLIDINFDVKPEVIQEINIHRLPAEKVVRPW